MRLAVLSDIHANLPALEAVLADVERAGVSELWCLGDVVGYGAQPDECTSLVAERCELCLVGNHDLAVLGELDISSFSPAAAAAVRWTQKTADPATLDFLRGLEPADESREVALYHASPRDPVWEYVLWPDQAAHERNKIGLPDTFGPLGGEDRADPGEALVNLVIDQHILIFRPVTDLFRSAAHPFGDHLR